MTIRFFGLARLPPSARKPRLLAAACRKALRSERADKPGELSIVFLDRREMLAMNKRFLRHGHDTDVIAFPYDGPAGPGLPFGDVYVSAWQARVQAKAMGHPVLTEVMTLIVHGTLHLLGWEDSSPRKKAAMFRRQESLLHAQGAA